MSNNYPPGVTGCEPEIVGYDDVEWDEPVTLPPASVETVILPVVDMDEPELAAHLVDAGDVAAVVYYHTCRCCGRRLRWGDFRYVLDEEARRVPICRGQRGESCASRLYAAFVAQAI